MPLLRLNDVSLSFGGPRLLDSVALQIEAGERIGLVGRNGSGKSTLMRFLAGHIAADAGAITRNRDIGIALLPQDVPDGVTGSVYDVVASGCQEHMELLREYHDLTFRIGRGHGAGSARRPGTAPAPDRDMGAWQHHQRVKTVIARIGLDEHAEFRSLSAGMKRRVFLARALAEEPDVLLLDEPTNHLDIATIVWLEDFLLKYEKAFMFVTHDRAFLARLATASSKSTGGACSPLPVITRPIWTPAGPPGSGREAAARFRQEAGQGRGLDQERGEGAPYPQRGQGTGIDADASGAGAQAGAGRRLAARHPGGERSGRMVVDAEAISFSWDDKKIFRLLHHYRPGRQGRHHRPERLGKTTLLKVLLGELEPGREMSALAPGSRSPTSISSANSSTRTRRSGKTLRTATIRLSWGMAHAT